MIDRHTETSSQCALVLSNRLLKLSFINKREYKIKLKDSLAQKDNCYYYNKFITLALVLI